MLKRESVCPLRFQFCWPSSLFLESNNNCDSRKRKISLFQQTFPRSNNCESSFTAEALPLLSAFQRSCTITTGAVNLCGDGVLVALGSRVEERAAAAVSSCVHSLFVNSPHAAAPTPEVLQQTCHSSCHHRISQPLCDSDSDTAEVPIPLRDRASSRNPRDGRPFTSPAQSDKSISAIAVKNILTIASPLSDNIRQWETGKFCTIPIQCNRISWRLFTMNPFKKLTVGTNKGDSHYLHF